MEPQATGFAKYPVIDVEKPEEDSLKKTVTNVASDKVPQHENI